MFCFKAVKFSDNFPVRRFFVASDGFLTIYHKCECRCLNSTDRKNSVRRKFFRDRYRQITAHKPIRNASRTPCHLQRKNFRTVFQMRKCVFNLFIGQILYPDTLPRLSTACFFVNVTENQLTLTVWVGRINNPVGLTEEFFHLIKTNFCGFFLCQIESFRHKREFAQVPLTVFFAIAFHVCKLNEMTDTVT